MLNQSKKTCLPCLAGRQANRQALTLIILLITCMASFAQDRNTIDSLKTIINNKTTKDTTIIHAYLELSYVYKNIDLDTALSYADLALNKSLKIKYKKGIAEAYRRKGITMINLSNYILADSLLNIAIPIYKEINNQTGVMNCYIALSAVACYKEENRLVIDYSLKALKIAEEKELIKKKGLIFNNIGIAYKNMGDYENATKYELDALRIFKEFDNKRLTARCNINIGCLFEKIDEFDKALKYQNEALKLYIEFKDINEQGICLLNIANVYAEQKKYNEALENYNNALELFKKSNDLKGIALNYLNIGEIYYELEKFNKANESLHKSLEISKQIEDKNIIAECYYTISLLETKQNNYRLAEEYCLKSIDFFENNNALDNQRKSLEQLATIYKLTGKYQKAYNTYIKAIAVKDSVFSIEKAEKIAQLEEKYLNEKKDKQIQTLEYENNIKTIKINHHKKTHRIYAIVLFLAIAAITIILILLRKKNMAYKFLVSKNLDVLSKERELKNVKEKLQSCDTCFQNGIPDDEKEKILKKLEKLFEKDKIFTQADLTLVKLAKQLSTNRTYLSQIINDELGKNYSDFINEYRVKESMLLFSDPKKNSELSIAGIANEVGFKSIPRYIYAFKKFAGITPSNFRAKIQQP